jgi:surface antigen/uncharacterized protein (DUF433 family)
VIVLVLALAISGYASLDRNLPAGLSLRLGFVNAEGLIAGEGGSAGSLQLGRSGTIIKPAAIPNQPVVSHNAIGYQVQAGEKLKDIAARFGVTVDDLRWSNYGALSHTDSDVTVGQSIAIPPVDGVVVQAKAGDTPQSIATDYKVDVSLIMDFNYLRTNTDAPLQAGIPVVVPGGRGPAFIKPILRSTATTATASSGASSSIVSGSASWTPATGNRFAFGYCTWYVYNRRPVPWLGNAWQWFGQAQAYGWATGQTPKAGAIFVEWASAWGHVAYVESVNADGSFVVSEMNYTAWDYVDYRKVSPTDGGRQIGFIY